jgi:serine protease
MKLTCLLLVCVGAVLGVQQQYIDGEFLMGIKDEVDQDAYFKVMKDYNVEMINYWHMGDTYIVHLRGEETDVIQASHLPGVKYWERNGIAYIQQCSSSTTDSAWGLDRIDQTAGFPAGYAPSSAEYMSGEDDGAGVRVYVADTGIFHEHTDFGGRASFGYTAMDSGDVTDGSGHGTHCAGTIGSNTYGVAKQASMIAVKVLSDAGFGSYDDIIEGMSWIETQHNDGDKDITSMSIGGGSSLTFDQGVISLIQDGVSVVVAAGNSDADACDYSPSGVEFATVVGATDIDDNRASFSNFGTCVDIFAPGVNIKSTWNDGGTSTISGTSMACPHVAGVAARYMSSQTDPANWNPGPVHYYLKNTATPDLVGDPQGPENFLLYAECPMLPIP